MDFRAITLQLDDVNEVARLAKMAEDANFGLAWGIDTPRSNAFIHMAAMAANTTKIQIGSGIARAFVRGPLQTAASAVDLDRLSNGRMLLGLGSGTRKVGDCDRCSFMRPWKTDRISLRVMIPTTVFPLARETTGSRPTPWFTRCSAAWRTVQSS